MKTKKLIKLTPLFNSIIQSVVITAIILLVIIIKESWPIIIAAPFAAGYLYFIVIGLFLGDECYDESIYGVCRYRIIKESLCHHSFFCFGKEQPIHLFCIKKTASFICVIMLLDLKRMPIGRLKI